MGKKDYVLDFEGEYLSNEEIPFFMKFDDKVVGSFVLHLGDYLSVKKYVNYDATYAQRGKGNDLVLPVAGCTAKPLFFCILVVQKTFEVPETLVKLGITFLNDKGGKIAQEHRSISIIRPIMNMEISVKKKDDANGIIQLKVDNNTRCYCQNIKFGIRVLDEQGKEVLMKINRMNFIDFVEKFRNENVNAVLQIKKGMKVSVAYTVSYTDIAGNQFISEERIVKLYKEEFVNWNPEEDLIQMIPACA